MADDERRAEIEAVAAEILQGYERGGTAGGVAKRAIAALDRVRDSRGDDEGRKTLEALAYRVYYGDDEEAREIARQCRDAEPARSPQGEDHKP